jgi:exosome complex component CSL4
VVVVRLAPGPGTYVRRGHVVSSVVGTVRATPRRRRPPPDDDDDEDDAGGLGGVVAGEGAIEGESWTISVVPERRRPASSSSSSSSYGKRPTVGSVVLGRVTRVSRPSHASVDIVASVPEGGGGGGGGGGGARAVVPYREPYSGTLRQGEMRPKSSADVRVEECVRPGDVILARIHAEGEREYVLSTAEAELGVVRAVCESSGAVMTAVSWKEMKCPETGAREGRKVAKPRSA